jgi:hypothetical protein
MNKFFYSLLCLLFSINTFSQDGPREVGFNRNRVFVGGNVITNLSFGQGATTTLGILPEIGYSLSKLIDVGVAGSYIYSAADFSNNNITDKQKTTQIGFGVFTRLHITNGFFVQAQPEFNNLKYKLEKGFTAPIEGTLSSTSFLVGIGFGERDMGNFNFFTTIMIDVQNNLYSPYRDRGNISPIIRGGFNFYLGRKKRK